MCSVESSMDGRLKWNFNKIVKVFLSITLAAKRARNVQIAFTAKGNTRSKGQHLRAFIFQLRMQKGPIFELQAQVLAALGGVVREVSNSDD